MEEKEFEWKIRSIIEQSSEVLDDPDTPEHIKEILEDIRENAQSVQQEFMRGTVRIIKSI